REMGSGMLSVQSRSAAEHPAVRGRILGVIEEMTDSLGYPPGLRMAGQLDTRVPAPVAEQLLAALREALANTAKHAQASRVDVTVEAGTDLVLTVRDNGTGLGKPTRRSVLANLAERSAELRGEVRAPPADGRRTQMQ